MKNRKPELLLPAGNTEAFFAAIEGGADAVYLGLKQFNARGRAANFTSSELSGVIKVARERKIKVYVTLNTLVKNREIKSILEQLKLLKALKPNAIIIQDWGVYFLIKNYFTGIEIHASTQMGIHNSCGANHALQKGFSRAIIARELTRAEIATMVKQTNMPLELFVHGALCYSFSGMCLFSSFIGGNSANRGNCMQVCRREFAVEGSEAFLPFNLRDNQLIQYIKDITELKIAALKVEGRLKQAEYVFKTAKAYRLAIDNPEQYDKALKILESDGGRDKTSWFFGNNVSNSLSQSNQTGNFTGIVCRVTREGFEFESIVHLKKGARIRINTSSFQDPFYFTVTSVSGNLAVVTAPGHTIANGDKVYVTSFDGMRFSEKLPFSTFGQKKAETSGAGQHIAAYKNSKVSGKTELYCRISGTYDLKHIDSLAVSGIFIKITDDILKNKSWVEACKNIRHKLYFEFPKFISEQRIADYRNIACELKGNGFNNFVINQLSQRLLLPSGSRFITGENVYVMNDFTALAIKSEGASLFVYPFENDYPNMITGKSRDGIVPLHFYPDLFYSRMPVHHSKDKTLKLPGYKGGFTAKVENGITIIRPEQPVSLFRFKEKLIAKGFFRFLIDFSASASNKDSFCTIMNAYFRGEKIQGSSEFNFKMELK
ncbi:MAG TPA: peptidase U32 family protein [Bacteroidales bacterium]|nr:peptidase U32 family protein [Bacteroidales bacterium]HQP04508.1 peptidase U32 family protein [Bacteroidales bacterium]